MLQATQSRTLSPLFLLALRARTLATHSSNLPTTSSGAPPAPAGSEEGSTSSKAVSKDGHLRPHLNIPINPNHGLYAFFRQKEVDGVVKYETVEPGKPLITKTGRSWTAAELRLKSFKDLHTLWYVLLRERNLLASQAEEARRIGAEVGRLSIKAMNFRCRKSMARMKYVINERRLAYERAVATLNEQRENDVAERQAADKAKRQRAEAAAKAEAKAAEKERRADGGQAQSAAKLVAGGLFESAPQSQGDSKQA